MSSQASYQVLCVCLGNICRSPTAEVILQRYCDDLALQVQVDSAGTSNYHPNKAPDARSQMYAKKRGYDLSSLRARQLTLQDFMDFDLILAMDQQNLADIQALQYKALQHFALQSLPAQIALMSEHDPIYPQLAVPDPYYGEQEGFERVLDQCESSSKAWAKQIQQQLKG